MLVLSRRPEQEIVIGDNIVVKVLGFRGKQVRLGITAPKGVPVHRREIHRRNELAAGGSSKKGKDPSGSVS